MGGTRVADVSWRNRLKRWAIWFGAGLLALGLGLLAGMAHGAR